LGPFDEVADVAVVKDEWESPFELTDDPMELSRGEDVPEEYARCCGSGIDGSLSLAYGEGRGAAGCP
jgi:hypothetical protein